MHVAVLTKNISGFMSWSSGLWYRKWCGTIPKFRRTMLPPTSGWSVRHGSSSLWKPQVSHHFTSKL